VKNSVKGDVTDFAELLFVSMLRRQELKDIERYGTPLETFNGRNALADAAEELVGAFQYLAQATMERKTWLANFEALLEELSTMTTDHPETLKPYIQTMFLPAMGNLCKKLYPKRNSSLPS